MSNIKCYWLHHVSHCSEIRPSFVTVTVHINIKLLEILSALNETVAAFVLFDKLDTIQVVTRISYLFFKFQLNQEMPAKKQALLKSLLQEIYELEVTSMKH